MAKGFLRGQSGGASPFKFPEYTGDYATYGTKDQGYMVLTSSGTFTAISGMLVDVFMVGAGGHGQAGNTDYSAGGGGGGGYTKTLLGRSVAKGVEIGILIGAGTNNDGGYTQFGLSDLDRANGGKWGYIARHGGDGGSGGGSGAADSGTAVSGAGGSDGENGGGTVPGVGQATTTKAFAGDISPFVDMLFSGAGGGGGWSSLKVPGLGGAGGGGNGGGFSHAGFDAQPGTGGGGGGGNATDTNSWAGGAGGSGICIIRWGY